MSLAYTVLEIQHTVEHARKLAMEYCIHPIGVLHFGSYVGYPLAEIEALLTVLREKYPRYTVTAANANGPNHSVNTNIHIEFS
jgi:hypothetical protein